MAAACGSASGEGGVTITTIAAASELPYVLRQAVALGSEVFDVELAAILLREEPRDSAEPRLSKIAHGLQWSSTPDQRDRALYRLIAEQQRAIATADVASVPGLDVASDGWPIRTLFALPLRGREDLEGVIYFGTATPRSFSHGP